MFTTCHLIEVDNGIVFFGGGLVKIAFKEKLDYSYLFIGKDCLFICHIISLLEIIIYELKNIFYELNSLNISLNSRHISLGIVLETLLENELT